MNLFELQGKISLDGRGAINTINSVMGAAGGLAKSLGGMALDVGTAAAKTVGAATAAGAAAYGALTVQGLKAVSSLEQNLGGSQQVFKDYADEIQASAEKAFAVMGSGTSDYLQTANRMGALFQGSGFEIQESAELTAKVMQRAADVASIMGIDTAWALESVTGAAKGNFTMMDNLGVAMNATTIEAYALSKGIKTSWKEMSNYQKISLAMEMFLEKTAYAAGNYAKENDTLAGSLSTAKAAVENFLDGSGGVEDLVPAIENAGEVIAENLIEIMPRLSEGLSEAAVQLAPMIPELLTAAVPGIAEGSVALIDGIVDALPDLTQALVDSAPILVEGFGEIFRSVGENLPEVAAILGPPLLEGVSQALSFVGFDVDASQIEAGISNWFNEIVAFVDGIDGTQVQATIAEIFTGAFDTGGTIFAEVKKFGSVLDTRIGDIIKTLDENGIDIGDIFSGFSEAVEIIANPVTKAVDTTLLALGKLVDWATKDGTKLNTFFVELGGGVKDFSGGLTTAIDAIGDLIEGNYASAGEKGGAVGRGLLDFLEESIGNWSWGYGKDVLLPIATDQSLPESWQKWAQNLIGQGELAHNGKSYSTTELNAMFRVDVDAESAKTAKAEIDDAVTEIENTVNGADMTLPPIRYEGSDIALADVEGALREIEEAVGSAQFAVPPVDVSAALESLNLGFYQGSMYHFRSGVSATSAGGGAVATAVGAEYYASGGVMLHPTQFGFNPYTGNRMIGGEAGPEAIAPISTLKSYVGEAVTERDTEQTMQLAEISEKLNKLEDLTNLVSDVIGMSIKVNGREFGRLVKNQI